MASATAPFSALSSAVLSDCRDRTYEFVATVDAMRRRAAAAAAAQQAARPTIPGGVTSQGVPLRHRASGAPLGSRDPLLEAGTSSSSPLLPMPTPAKSLPQQSEFAHAASQIGRSIYGVAEKLEHLTKLAKERSLFNDPVAEINELTYVIKRDIVALNKDIEALGAFVQRSARGAGVASRHSLESNNAVVTSLKSKLATTTKTFGDVLVIRTKNMREKQTRRNQFESRSVHQLKKRSVDSFGLTDTDKTTSEATIAGSRFAAANRDGRAGLRAEELAAESRDIADQHQQPPMATAGEVALQVMTEPIEDQYYASRAAAIQEIEKTIVEVGGMYKELATIVGMQEELTLRIDDNINASLDNMENAQDQLVKLNTSAASTQTLLLKIFAIILFFLMLAFFIA